MARKRKCKWCGTYTEDYIVTPVAAFCGMDCAIEYANKAKNKARERQLAKDKQSQARKVKEANKAHRERRRAAKTKSEWLSELQSLFNKYIRLRDANDGCISCDKPSTWSGQFHAGHYYSRGHSSGLRFNLWNVHKQCSVCNNHLSGNIGQYTPRLIEKIGQDKADWLLEHKSDRSDYDIEWIKKAIKITKKAIKREQRRI